jgi:hypothetical protein
MRMNKTLSMVRKSFYWLQARSDIEKWCRHCKIYSVRRCPRTGNRSLIRKDSHWCRRFPPKERPRNPIHPDLCRLFHKLTKSLLHFSQKASKLAEALFTNFCRFGIPWELHIDQCRKFEYRIMQEVFNAWECARRALRPCTRSRKAWWNTTSKRSRSIYGKSLKYTRVIKTQY